MMWEKGRGGCGWELCSLLGLGGTGRTEGPGDVAARRSRPRVCASTWSLMDSEGVLLRDGPLGANGRETRVSATMKVWGRHWQGLRAAGVSPPWAGTCLCLPSQGKSRGSPGSNLPAPTEVISQREPSVQLTP